MRQSLGCITTFPIILKESSKHSWLTTKLYYINAFYTLFGLLLYIQYGNMRSVLSPLFINTLD